MKRLLPSLNSKNLNNQKGQTLIVVLMLMIISLSIGLAVSQRIISSSKRSVTLDSSSRAQAVAEAAIEKMLPTSTTTLDSYITNNNCGTNCQLTISGADGVSATATVTLAYAGNSTSLFNTKVERDAVTELDLTGYGNRALEICWDGSSGNTPSVSALFVYGASVPYTSQRFAYNSASTTHSSNGFSTAAPDLSYANCFTIGAQSNPRFVRIRALYSDLNLYVIPKSGGTLPVQGYLMTSVGRFGGVTKTIQALKSRSFVPASFDFVLFNTSEDTVLTN
jgi:Tfp pilus assembly protein PilX